MAARRVSYRGFGLPLVCRLRVEGSQGCAGRWSVLTRSLASCFFMTCHELMPLEPGAALPASSGSPAMRPPIACSGYHRWELLGVLMCSSGGPKKGVDFSSRLRLSGKPRRQLSQRWSAETDGSGMSDLFVFSTEGHRPRPNELPAALPALPPLGSLPVEPSANERPKRRYPVPHAGRS